MSKKVQRIFVSAVLAMLMLGLARDVAAFKHIKLGAPLPDARLLALSGEVVNVLNVGAKVNVVLFVRPNHRHSQDALSVMTRACNKFKKRNVHCVAIVSAIYDKNEVEKMVSDAGWTTAQTLIDPGDKYYGELGVVLHPTFGIADGKKKLIAYDPFSGINSFRVVVAHILFVLGDIDEKQLKLEINPEPSQKIQESDRAITRYKYARALFDGKLYDEALKQVLEALKFDTSLAKAHGLLALIYATTKQCKEAEPASARALELDKQNADAKRARQLCPSSR